MKRSRRCSNLVELAASSSMKKFCLGSSDKGQILPGVGDVFDMQPPSFTYSREKFSESPYALEFDQLDASSSTKKFCLGSSDNDQILPDIGDVFDIRPSSFSCSREYLSESPYTLELDELELAASSSTKQFCLGLSDNGQALPVIGDVFDMQSSSFPCSREHLSESPYTLEFDEWRESRTFPGSPPECPPHEQRLSLERTNSPRDVSSILNEDEEYYSTSLETQTSHKIPKRDLSSVSTENTCKSPVFGHYSTQRLHVSPCKSQQSIFIFDNSTSLVPFPNHRP